MMARKMKDTDSEDEIRVDQNIKVCYAFFNVDWIRRKPSRSSTETITDSSRRLNFAMS